MPWWNKSFNGVAGVQMMLERAALDHRIDAMPAPFQTEAGGVATPYDAVAFAPQVASACRSPHLVAAGLRIAKTIVLGNVAVGKTSLVNQ